MAIADFPFYQDTERRIILPIAEFVMYQRGVVVGDARSPEDLAKEVFKFPQTFRLRRMIEKKTGLLISGYDMKVMKLPRFVLEEAKSKFLEKKIAGSKYMNVYDFEIVVYKVLKMLLKTAKEWDLSLEDSPDLKKIAYLQSLADTQDSNSAYEEAKRAFSQNASTLYDAERRVAGSQNAMASQSLNAHIHRERSKRLSKAL